MCKWNGLPTAMARPIPVEQPVIATTLPWSKPKDMVNERNTKTFNAIWQMRVGLYRGRSDRLAVKLRSLTFQTNNSSIQDRIEHMREDSKKIPRVAAISLLVRNNRSLFPPKWLTDYPPRPIIICSLVVQNLLDPS